MAHDYNEYKDIPHELIPPKADLWALMYIVLDIKTAVQLRHDFHTALEILDQAQGVRRLHPPVVRWESDFAASVRPGSKTLVGIAAEHERIALDAQKFAANITNPKLAALLRQNLRSLLPDIGFNKATGEPLRRLLHKGRSVLQIFDPLGVGDNAKLIKLLLKPPLNYAFYW